MHNISTNKIFNKMLYLVQSEPDTLDILEAAASKKSRRNKNNQVSEKKGILL